MSKKAVEKLFDSLYELTDLRQLFRETAPDHDLEGERKGKAIEILNRVEKNLEGIRSEI